jgi:CHAD domain-containing protein
MDDGPVKRALGFISPLRRLLAVGQGTLSRTVIIALDSEEKTHARAHVHTLQADKSGTPITLATIQALRGYDEAFALMSRHIAQLGYPLGPDIYSLYEQLVPDYTPYNPKPVLFITKNEQAFKVANDIVTTHVQIARQNEPGIMADYDTEFLHDYRVSLRKVRSVISLFKGVYNVEQTLQLKKAFADLMSPTGRMRDLDVYLLDRQHYYELLPESLHDGLTIMYGIFSKEREKELKKMKSLLKSSAYKQSIEGLEKLYLEPGALQPGPNADRSAYLYACELIWKRYSKVCKIARAIDQTTPDETVHDLRIHCKKLRYLMDFFSLLFEANTIKSLLKSLKVLQDNLGLFNDYSVQQVSLQEFVQNHTSRNREKDLQVAKSVGALIVILSQRQLEERAKVVSNFEKFDSESTQQKFRELFKHQQTKAEVKA